MKVAAIPGVQTFVTVPSALPGGSNFPVEFLIARTAERTRSCNSRSSCR